MQAWVFQDGEDVHNLGEDKAPWQVRWREPDGRQRKKTFGVGPGAKKLAERFKNKVNAELMTGTYQLNDRKPWKDFRAEYERRILAGLSPDSRKQARTALDHFERIVKPARVAFLDTGHIDDFIAKRRTEPGLKRGSTVSPASVNADLRQIKAALNVAVEWSYLKQLPRFHMEKLTRKLPRYVTGEHFAAIYAACDKAKLPRGLPNVAAGDWWRTLLATAYMTGWRIGELLALRRDDLDLDAGFAVTRGEDNKGRRDERVKLHPAVVEHLKRLASFDPMALPWHYNRRTLHAEFCRIQEAAGIHLPCRGEHEHTRYCHVYGFHDLRRAFATMNADKLTPDALQALMRHKSYLTTQVYINMARQMDEAVAGLHVPEVLKGAN